MTLDAKASKAERRMAGDGESALARDRLLSSGQGGWTETMLNFGKSLV